VTSTGQATISGRHRETGSMRDRSPEHHELRAYNALTGRQVTRTFLVPRLVEQLPGTARILC
jgi:hypothetical protein